MSKGREEGGRIGRKRTEEETGGQRARTKTEEEGLTDVLKDIDDEERRDEVVDALHVAAGRVADRPDEQDTLKDLTDRRRNTQVSTHTMYRAQYIEEN